MRFALTVALGLFLTCAAGTSLFAADAPAADGKAVNTICPNEGDKVDPAIPPVAGKTKDGKTVMIGVCCKDCLATVKKNPDKYADAAVANKKN